MAQRNHKRRNSTFGVLVAVVIFIAAICIWGYARFAPTATTQTILQGEVQDTINAKGIAVFKEELMTSSEKGISIINYPDGERVVAKTHIATLYTGNVDDGKSTQISELNERINYLETNMKNLQKEKNSKESLNENLINKMKQIAYYSVSGNFENIQRETAEIESIIATSSTSDLAAQLEELKKQRDDVERTIAGDKEEYISKEAGVVYSALDGYETTITPKTTESIDPSAFKTLWGSKPVDYSKNEESYIYGKIVNNFEATILSLVDTKDIDGIKEGQTAYIQFTQRSSESIPAIVEKIHNTGSSTLITLTVTKQVEDFLAERKFEFKFVKTIHKGLKVPAEALENAGENNTVLVIKDSIVTRKKIEILAARDDYVIIKENNADKDSLLLYDLVITKSKNVSEGQIITDYK